MDTEATSGDEAEKIATLLRGYYVVQAVYVAARLGVADLLAGQAAAGENGLSSEQLAQSTGTHEDALYRMMRALASVGLFEEKPARHFVLTRMGSLLRSDVAGSMRPAALVAGEMQYKVWAAFRESVKLGTPGFERIFRQGVFAFFNEHPDLHALFNQAMTQHALQVRQALVAACDVRPGETIVDAGGGMGGLLVALLEVHPQARGILMDGTRVVGEAREMLRDSAVAGRLNFVAGDFFKAVPHGEVVLLGSILHMFSDGAALQVLRNCRAAVARAARGRVYVIERLLRGPNEADAAKWDDLNMLVMTGGRERTFEEYATLLQEAGFENPTQAGDGMIVAAVR